MARDFRRIDTEKNMSKPKLKIKSLYKIFGPKGESYIEPVKNGISKQELLDNHGHVLGLNDINLDIPEQRIQHHGTIRFRKVNFDNVIALLSQPLVRSL